MLEFWQALVDPDVTFLRTALLMGLLASAAFGMTGSLVVAKRISYVAGAISHAVLGGIGAALYFQKAHGVEWLHPLIGALAAALLAAVVISWIRASGFEREDSVIGAVWATGMAAGLVFIARTPGFVDPMSYLFGNILILSQADLLLVALMDLLLLLVMVFGYNRLQALCFDEEQARLRGLRVGAYYTLLLCVIACTVVLLVSVVGVVLVVALLTIPAAMAGHHVRSLGGMMGIASLLTLAFVSCGILLSFLSDWPVGPTIILVAAAAYLLQSGIIRLVRR
ncbi:MAG: metal ABC transporter permease [Puniceicoccaceae bacterium]